MYAMDQQALPKTMQDVLDVEEAGPPCCKVSCLRSCGEENCICRCLGRCGILSEDTSLRKGLFTLTFLLSVLALGLQIIIVVGTTENASNIQTFPWSTGSFTFSVSNKVDVDIGANMIVFGFSNGTDVDETFDSNTCQHAIQNNSTYCKDCKDAANGQVTSSYTGLISGLGQISTNWKRRSYKHDINCQKVLGTVTGFVGVVSNLITVSSFTAACVTNINDAFEDADFMLGSGMICLVVSTIIKAIDTAVNIAVPTPKGRH